MKNSFQKTMKSLMASCIILSIINIASVHQAFAQNSLRIAAIVNESAISAYDLNTRIRMIITLSGLPKTNDMIERLKGDTLRGLIDETLKLQEAEKFNISISDDEIFNSISQIEKSRNLKPGQLPALLESNKIDIESLILQIKANLTWSQTVVLKHRNNVEISETTIDTELKKAEEKRELPIFLLSEIVIPTNNKIEQAKKQISNLFQDLQKGADFGALARSFSQSPSASGGGDIGWLRQDQLPNNLKPIVANMRPGDFSNPVALQTSFVIMKLREYRENSKPNQQSPKLTISQVHLALPADTPQTTVATYFDSAKKSTMQATDCESLVKNSEAISSPLSGSLGTIEQSKLPTHLADAIGGLADNTPSAPIRTNDGVIVLMICERETSQNDDTEITRENIRIQLFNERMSIYARQYLRDIRRNAFIDIRL